MANYAKTNIENEGRVELHETLSLTGAEISINNLPAGANVPFVHSHKNNEEVYSILSGKGKVIIDGEEIALTTGCLPWWEAGELGNCLLLQYYPAVFYKTRRSQV